MERRARPGQPHDHQQQPPAVISAAIQENPALGDGSDRSHEGIQGRQSSNSTHPPPACPPRVAAGRAEGPGSGSDLRARSVCATSGGHISPICDLRRCASLPFTYPRGCRVAAHRMRRQYGLGACHPVSKRAACPFPQQDAGSHRPGAPSKHRRDSPGSRAQGEVSMADNQTPHTPGQEDPSRCRTASKPIPGSPTATSTPWDPVLDLGRGQHRRRSTGRLGALGIRPRAFRPRGDDPHHRHRQPHRVPPSSPALTVMGAQDRVNRGWLLSCVRPSGAGAAISRPDGSSS
jgi:hypothetical protein